MHIRVILEIALGFALIRSLWGRPSIFVAIQSSVHDLCTRAVTANLRRIVKTQQASPLTCKIYAMLYRSN
jgi:hypothetical protein